MIVQKVTRKRDRLKSFLGLPKTDHGSVTPNYAESTESKSRSNGPPSPHVHAAATQQSSATAPSPTYQRQQGPLPLWEAALIRLESSTSGDESCHAQRLRASIADDPLTPIHEKELVESVRIAAQGKQKSLCETIWSVQIGSKTIRSDQVSHKILTWLNKFKDIGDQVVTYDPYHAALPWAAFKLLLTVITINSQQEAELLDGVDISLRAFLRCRIFESQYPHIKSKISSISEDVVDALKEDIVRLYTAIFSFLGLALQCFESGTLSNTASAFLEPERFSSKLNQITARDEELEKTVRVSERLLQTESRREILDRFDSSQKLLDSQLDSVNNQLRQVWQSLGNEQMSLISRWISNVAYEDDLRRFQRSRSTDTCGWLLAHETYQQWAVSRQSATLWLHGIPGAGKSHLSSRVIESALQQHETIAYFFCDRNREDYRDPAKVLQCLVKQLSIDLDMGIDQETVDAYENKKRTGFASDQLSVPECQVLLSHLIRHRGQVKIVIDGLDECDQATRVADVLDVLGQVMKSSSAIVKIFIASRDERDIREGLGNSEGLKIKAQNQQDIVRFVQSAMDRNKWWSEKMSPDVREMVLRQFSIKSQGMFLWAKLHIDDLLKYESDKLVIRWLDSLPEGLEKTYDGIYDSIDKRMRKYVDQAFLWMMLYEGFLENRSPGIISGLALQDPEADFDPEVSMSPESFLSLFRNLIMVDEFYKEGPENRRELLGRTCRFSHLSVREYLEQRRGLRMSDANKLALHVSIKYWYWVATLKSSQPNLKFFPSLGNNGPLEIMMYYIKSGVGQTEPSFQELLLFLGDPIRGSNAYWASARRHPYLISVSTPTIEEIFITPIEAAVAAGCLNLVGLWLKAGLGPNPKTGSNQSLLLTACEGLRPFLIWNKRQDGLQELHDRLEMVRLLLESGSLPSPEGREIMVLLETPIQNRLGLGTRVESSPQAKGGIAEQLVVELVLILCTKGIIKCGSKMMTPLHLLAQHWAVAPGQAAIRALIGHGVDPTVTDEGGNTALHHSCLWKDIEDVGVVEALLTGDGREAINQRNRLGYTPLHICCQNPATRRNGEVLKLLLASTGDPTLPDNSGNTALHMACMVGNIESVKILLEAGGGGGGGGGAEAVVNRRNMDGHTPLHICCHRALDMNNNPEMMRLLLDHGADPNEGDLDGGGTALHTICQTFTMANVQRRMPPSNDDDDDAVFDHTHHVSSADALLDLMMMMMMFQSSSTAQIQMLLDHGVDVDRISDRGATALHIVCAEGHVSTARTLIEIGGADVSCSGPWRGTALDVLEYRKRAGRCDDDMYDEFLGLLTSGSSSSSSSSNE